jgi:hypothetical protein
MAPKNLKKRSKNLLLQAPQTDVTISNFFTGFAPY